MSLCSRCGVDIGDERVCPLCGKPAGDGPAAGAEASEAAESPAGPGFAAPGDRPIASPAAMKRRLLAAEVISFSVCLAAAAVALADLALGGGLSWSLYPLAALGAVWLLFCPPLLAKRVWVGAASAAVAPPALLLAIDLIAAGRPWFAALGLPIAVAAELGAGLAYVASIRSKRRGLNVFAYGLMAASLVSGVVDGAVSYWQTGGVRLGWSVIVLLALLPVAAFLLYAHYRLATNATLKRMFHL